MTCARQHRAIEAYVDGECGADEAAALRAHLQTCPACRSRAQQLSALQELVQRTLSAEAAPADLWPRIASRLDRAAAAPRAAPRRHNGSRLRPLLVAAAVAVALAAGVPALLQHPEAQSEETVVSETVQDLVTFRLSRRPLDLAAGDPAVVHAWFDGKLRFELPPLKARALGYELTGARLCWLLGRRGGAFSYLRGARLMTLYVIQGDAVALAGGRFDPALETVAVRRQVANYGSLVWRRGDLVLALVSDAPDEEMTAFAAAVIGRGDEAGRRPAAAFAMNSLSGGDR